VAHDAGAIFPMTNGKIVVHHVGARGAGGGLTIPAAFRDDVINVLYEADTACAEEMARTNSDPGTKILCYCLGATDTSGILQITRNPYFSSLLEPDRHFGENTCQVELSGEIDGVPMGGTWYDALYKHEMAVTKTAPVKVHSMDGLFQNKILSRDLLPDFMILDTQGTEFDILSGARSVISQGLLGFATEIEFSPMYTGQKLAADIMKFAEKNGFRLAGFTSLYEVNCWHPPLGLRSKDFLTFGDCLFFRDVASLRQVFADDDEAFAAASLKLAFLALTFGYFSFSAKILRHELLLKLLEQDHALMRERAYVRFLRELAEKIEATPSTFLYTDRNELASARRKYLPRPAQVGRMILERNPFAKSILRRMKNARLAVRLPRLVLRPKKNGSFAAYFGSRTPVEKVLAQHGFAWIVSDLSERRRIAAPYARRN
jgi:hypothetical protein